MNKKKSIKNVFIILAFIMIVMFCFNIGTINLSANTAEEIKTTNGIPNQGESNPTRQNGPGVPVWDADIYWSYILTGTGSIEVEGYPTIPLDMTGADLQLLQAGRQYHRGSDYIANWNPKDDISVAKNGETFDFNPTDPMMDSKQVWDIIAPGITTALSFAISKDPEAYAGIDIDAVINDIANTATKMANGETDFSDAKVGFDFSGIQTSFRMAIAVEPGGILEDGNGNKIELGGFIYAGDFPENDYMNTVGQMATSSKAGVRQQPGNKLVYGDTLTALTKTCVTQNYMGGLEYKLPERTYTVTFIDDDYQKTVSNIKPGSMIDVPSRPDKVIDEIKHKFRGWNEDQEENGEWFDGGPVNRDWTVYAVYVADEKFTVTFIDDGFNHVVKDIEAGSTIGVPSRPNKTVDGKEYIFSGWNTSSSGSGQSFTSSTKVYKNWTVYAVYTEKGTEKPPKKEKPYIEFSPSHGWTNIPYQVTAELIFPERFLQSVIYDNSSCYCHSFCRYCSCTEPCPGNDRTGRNLVDYYQDEETGEWVFEWEEYTYDCGHPHPLGHDHASSSCGSGYCIGEHYHPNFTSRSREWWPWRSTGSGINRWPGLPSGGIGASGSSQVITYYINRDGDWNVSADFELSKGQIINEPSSPYVYNCDVFNGHLTAVSEERYKFDGTDPVVTVSCNSDWTNQNRYYSVSFYDALRGLNGTESVEVVELSSGSVVSRAFSGTLTQSGTYRITGSAGDIAGNTSSSTGTIKIDKIPPAVKYAFVSDNTVKNGVRNRYETTSSNKGYYINISDIGGVYKESGLVEAKCKVINKEQSDSFTEGQVIDLMPYISRMEAGEYIFIPLDESFVKKQGEVQLLAYARDAVGNVTKTTSNVITADEYIKGQIRTSEGNKEAYIGPRNIAEIDTPVREIPRGIYFINTSNDILPPGPDGVGSTDTALVITEVNDIKWKDVYVKDSAKTSNFAMYSNKLKDTIGLGYLVRFRYNTYGYGIDVGDATVIDIKLYGKVGDKYERLDVYSPVANSKETKKVTLDYSRVQCVRTATNGNYTGDGSDVKIGDCKLKADEDKASLYFNFYLPGNATFKLYNTNTNYTGGEVLVKFDITSRKYMAENPLPYSINSDPKIKWYTETPPYGNSKVVETFADGSTKNGQVFWYDLVETAITDIRGERN